MDRVDRGFIENHGLESVKREAFDNTGTDTYQIAEHERIVFIDTSLGNGTVYLPPVGPMVGKTVTIQIEAYSGTATVKPYEHYSSKPDSVIYDGSGAETSQALASDEAFTVLLSTGRAWIALQFDLDTAS